MKQSLLIACIYAKGDYYSVNIVINTLQHIVKRFKADVYKY